MVKNDHGLHILTFYAFVNFIIFTFFHILRFTHFSVFVVFTPFGNKALCVIKGRTRICVVVLPSEYCSLCFIWFAFGDSSRGDSQERSQILLLSFSPLWTGLLFSGLFFCLIIQMSGRLHRVALWFYSRSPLSVFFLVFYFNLFIQMSGRLHRS